MTDSQPVAFTSKESHERKVLACDKVQFTLMEDGRLEVYIYGDPGPFEVAKLDSSERKELIEWLRPADETPPSSKEHLCDIKISDTPRREGDTLILDYTVTPTDSMERYYAAIETEQNFAEEEYFSARPQLMATRTERALFRAGFERAYSALWNKRPSNETGGERHVCWACQAPYAGPRAEGKCSRCASGADPVRAVAWVGFLADQPKPDYDVAYDDASKLPGHSYTAIYWQPPAQKAAAETLRVGASDWEEFGLAVRTVSQNCDMTDLARRGDWLQRELKARGFDIVRSSQKAKVHHPRCEWMQPHGHEPPKCTCPSESEGEV